MVFRVRGLTKVLNECIKRSLTQHTNGQFNLGEQDLSVLDHKELNKSEQPYRVYLFVCNEFQCWLYVSSANGFWSIQNNIALVITIVLFYFLIFDRNKLNLVWIF